MSLSCALVGCALPFGDTSPVGLRADERNVIDVARDVRPDLNWAAHCARGQGADDHGVSCTLGFDVPANYDLDAVVATVASTYEALYDRTLRGTEPYIAEVVPIGEAGDGRRRARALKCADPAANVDFEFSIFGTDDAPPPATFSRGAKRAKCVLGPPGESASDVFQTGAR